MRGLAPADYYVAAVDKRGIVDLSGEIENPEFLESRVATATRPCGDESKNGFAEPCTFVYGSSTTGRYHMAKAKKKASKKSAKKGGAKKKASKKK